MKKKAEWIILLFFMAGFLTGCRKVQYFPIARKNAFTGNIATSTPLLRTVIPDQIQENNEVLQITPVIPSQSPTATIQILQHLPYLLKSGNPTVSNIRIIPRVLRGNKQGRNFSLELSYPEFSGTAQNPIGGFSAAIQAWLNQQSERFLIMVDETNTETANGYLTASYSFPSRADSDPKQIQFETATNLTGDTADKVILDVGVPVISLLFQTSEYFGGAHPLEQHMTITYDLSNGRVLNLSDLFSPGADYLARISQYCIQELYRNNSLEPEQIRSGAGPLVENYQNWSLTPKGLLITFEEYQVGPYAAGPQRILIPFDSLADLINPQGPIKNSTVKGQ